LKGCGNIGVKALEFAIELDFPISFIGAEDFPMVVDGYDLIGSSLGVGFTRGERFLDASHLKCWDKGSPIPVMTPEPKGWQ